MLAWSKPQPFSALRYCSLEIVPLPLNKSNEDSEVDIGEMVAFSAIFGDPGADSRVTRKSKRPSLQERKRSPWDSSLNRPVPKPIKILVCDWAPNQSPALFVLLSWLLIWRCSPTTCLIACSPFVYLPASCRRVSSIEKFQEQCFSISRDIVYSVFTTFQLQ